MGYLSFIFWRQNLGLQQEFQRQNLGSSPPLPDLLIWKYAPWAFIMANFNYCPAVWHFCSAKDKHKVEKMQERTLRFVYSDYCSSYSELLDKAETYTLELRRIHFICTEIYKTTNNFGPEYMNSLVVPNQSHYSSRRPLNLFVPRNNQTTYGLKVFATKVPYFGIAYRKK